MVCQVRKLLFYGYFRSTRHQVRFRCKFCGAWVKAQFNEKSSLYYSIVQWCIKITNNASLSCNVLKCSKRVMILSTGNKIIGTFYPRESVPKRRISLNTVEVEITLRLLQWINKASECTILRQIHSAYICMNLLDDYTGL